MENQIEMRTKYQEYINTLQNINPEEPHLKQCYNVKEFLKVQNPNEKVCGMMRAAYNSPVTKSLLQKQHCPFHQACQD